MTFDQKTIVVGQRIYCALYGGKNGVVTAISGKQQPETLQSFKGVGVSGGCAEIDVAFEDGSRSQRVPEGIVRGVQWKIFPEVVSPEEVQQAIQHTIQTLEQRTKKEDAEKREFHAAVEALRANPDFSHLEQSSSCDGVTAGRNIRKILQREFPGVKFSVRKESYGCIRVGWEDGPTDEQVDKIVEKFQEGRFNGMEDIYELTRHNVWTEVFGGAKYVHTSRDLSENLIAQAIDILWEKYSGNFEGVEKITAAQFKNGEAMHRDIPRLNDWKSLSDHIWMVARGISIQAPGRPARSASRGPGR